MPSFELPTWTAFADYLGAPDVASMSIGFFVAASVLMVAIGAVIVAREVRELHQSAYPRD